MLLDYVSSVYDVLSLVQGSLTAGLTHTIYQGHNGKAPQTRSALGS